MPSTRGKGVPSDSSTGEVSPAKPGRFLRFLRDSHIFASAIREILDVRLLQEASPSSLTPSQFHLLKLMSFNGLHQAGEVAAFLGVSAPAATKTIDKLERLGFVSRNPSTGDRRATPLAVSRKGRRLVRKYEELREARLTPVVEGFKPTELDQFSRLLERFSASLLAQDQLGEKFCLRCAGYIEDDCPVSEVYGGCRYQNVRASRRGEGRGVEVS
ncbi:MAG: MarR family winged helix-turn-helix transcriptional regulator [Planctomycetota bacterium]